MTVVLDNIRSSWNVGSIMRTCDAVGADLILIGYTPKPVGHTLDLIKKTAIGAELTVPWQHFEHYNEVLEQFSAKNHVGVELNPGSQNIFDYLSMAQALSQRQEDLFMWFGNEIHGLEPALSENLSATVFLPMSGTKESLNVSSCVCATVYLFQFAYFRVAGR